MASTRNNTHILCLVVALLVMSTSFLTCQADEPGSGWCADTNKVCRGPAAPENEQKCQDYCSGFGYNPQKSRCVNEPEPTCCCFNN